MENTDYPIEFIKWADSFGAGSSWGTLDFPPDLHYCYSISWIIYEDKNLIVVAPHASPENIDINAEENFCGEMTIPKCSIKERKKLII